MIAILEVEERARRVTAPERIALGNLIEAGTEGRCEGGWAEWGFVRTVVKVVRDKCWSGR
jgi:hypothetical protein